MPLTPHDWSHLQRLCAAYRLNLGGVHRRNRIGERPGLGTGNAIEFQEHRAYQPGDDLRRLDWAAYARSGQMVIRLERQEVMPQLDLTVDLSRSMWGLTEAKRHLFEQTLAVVLILAQRMGLDVRCLLAGDEFRVIRGATPVEALAACERTAGQGRHTLLEHLDLLTESRRHHASQLWISDLLFEHDPVLLSGRAASETAAWGVIQVLDAQDILPEPEAACLVEACEDGARLDLRLDKHVVATYRAAFEAHRDLWRDHTITRGGVFVSMTTEQTIDQAMISQWTTAGLVEPG